MIWFGCLAIISATEYNRLTGSSPAEVKANN
jgi:hypothetical protein